MALITGMQNQRLRPAQQGRSAIFLDKDGTLVHDIPYNISPERVAFTPHTIEALRLFQQEDYQLFIVTNQSGMAKGLFNADDMQRFQEFFVGLMASYGIRLSGFYYCPHHPEGRISDLAVQCACRKPLPGMLLKAAEEHDINLKNSWMIGDILHDVEAGNRAGCRTVLIHNGNETEWKMSPWRIPELVAANLLEAAGQMLCHKRPVDSTTSIAYPLEKSF